MFQISELSEMQPQVNEPISEVQKLTWKEISNGLWMILIFIAGHQDNEVEMSRKDKVPRFWADDDDVFITDAIALGVGVFFGAIHCIAWFFFFPTYMALLI